MYCICSAKLLGAASHCSLMYVAVISYRGLGISRRRSKRHKALVKSSAKLKDEAGSAKTVLRSFCWLQLQLLHVLKLSSEMIFKVFSAWLSVATQAAVSTNTSNSLL